MHRKSSRRRYEAFRNKFRQREFEEPIDEKDDQPRPERRERQRYFRQYVRWLGNYWRTALLLVGLSLAVLMLVRLRRRATP